MKLKYLFISLVILLVGCSNHDGNEMIVQVYVKDENKYEDIYEITEKNKIQEVTKILENAHWENTAGLKDYVPNYKFYFPDESKQTVLVYNLWVSTNKEYVELGINQQEKYVKLNKNESNLLFEILTGFKLKHFKR